MMRSFATDAGRLKPLGEKAEEVAHAVWIDLVNPSSAEEAELEQKLALDIPTKEEMEEIEISSRLYTENGASFMTAILPANADGDDVDMHPVTFVLTATHLVTVRYHEPRAFRTFPVRAEKVAMGCDTAEGVLIALLEAVVDRLADILERAGRDIDGISRSIFRKTSGKPTKSADLQSIIESIGRKGDLTSNVRDSLVTLERLAGYLGQAAIHQKSGKDARERIKTLSRDIRSLSDHSGFMSQKVTFLLDATLGMINIEQNAIIKIFSVAAVVFLPPTLIASIYGMNFEYMPELKWLVGYPFAIGLMIASAILPYVFFKRRGWL
ncbi:magnesium/cobalt transporter CorA [Roseospira navarrensis]|uniref:Magnesium transport protein CorA n=1 Tax=Roseospira navarrensis TaxID=140058 RepID=A0A7X1ZHB5_9PROT|nr:magnesium/cobalt transporter CorA [Roseospira navarrensis]MQX38563.1 magnesium/cobalt transporter CorA [Roseospira navarrensis]